MELARVEAALIRPGHTVRLEYGPILLIDVTEVHVEEAWVRFCGTVFHADGTLFKHTTDSRHSHHTRMRVVADRNDSPAGVNPAWNGLDRVARQWTDSGATVWSLDDPTEPIGHGGRLRGTVTAGSGGWAWRSAFTDAAGELVGDYIAAERALLDATAHLIEIEV